MIDMVGLISYFGTVSMIMNVVGGGAEPARRRWLRPVAAGILSIVTAGGGFAAAPLQAALTALFMSSRSALSASAPDWPR